MSEQAAVITRTPIGTKGKSHVFFPNLDGLRFFWVCNIPNP